jgi:hypothetical protein
VCVCVREREREKKNYNIYTGIIQCSEPDKFSTRLNATLSIAQFNPVLPSTSRFRSGPFYLGLPSKMLYGFVFSGFQVLTDSSHSFSFDNPTYWQSAKPRSSSLPTPPYCSSFRYNYSHQKPISKY